MGFSCSNYLFDGIFLYKGEVYVDFNWTHLWEHSLCIKCRFTANLLEDIHLLIHYVDLYLYQTVHWFHWAWSVIAVLELCQHTRGCSSSPYSGVMFELFQSSWLSSQYTSKFTHPMIILKNIQTNAVDSLLSIMVTSFQSDILLLNLIRI